MSGIGQTGAASVSYIGDARSGRAFNLQTPAGWAALWWILSVIIILIMFYSL